MRFPPFLKSHSVEHLYQAPIFHVTFCNPFTKSYRFQMDGPGNEWSSPIITAITVFQRGDFKFILFSFSHSAQWVSPCSVHTHLTSNSPKSSSFHSVIIWHNNSEYGGKTYSAWIIFFFFALRNHIRMQKKWTWINCDFSWPSRPGNVPCIARSIVALG